MGRIYPFGHPNAFLAKERPKLQSNNIEFTRVRPPAKGESNEDGRDYSDIKLMKTLYCWTLEHDPPATVLVATSDVDFLDIITDIRKNGYEVIVAHGPEAKPKLRKAASTSVKFMRLLKDDFRHNV